MGVRQGAEVRATPETVAALVERHKGRTGGQGAEATLMWAASRPGFVEVTTSRGALVTDVVRRCGSAMTRFWDCGEYVTMEFPARDAEGRKVFRGIEYAFAPIDIDYGRFGAWPAPRRSDGQTDAGLSAGAVPDGAQP